VGLLLRNVKHVKPHPLLKGFEDSRIARFVFDQAQPGEEAQITFDLEQDGRRRILRFTVPAESIQYMELLMPPSLEVQDHSDEGWEKARIQVVHPHSGHTYFYASKIEEIPQTSA